jgi:peptide/nickel transport system substrate-binding protein
LGSGSNLGGTVRTTPSRRSGVLVRLLALLVVSALLAAACGGDDDDDGGGGGGQAESGGGASTTVPEDEGEPQRGGTIVYGVEADTSNPWTPQRSTCAISCYIVFNSVYDPLVLPDEDGNPQPNLLESFEPNDDFTEWTLTPRDGITFHDGTLFDAEAIRYNLQDQLDSALTQAALKSLDSVALNPEGTAVVVTMNESWSNFPIFLASQLGYMASPRWRQATKDGTAPETEPVGTGPFIFEEYVVGSHFRASRNEDYWKQDPEGRELPFADAVEVRIIPEAQTRINGLESGELNIAHTSNGQLVKRLRDNGDVDEIEIDRFGETSYIMLNVDEGPGSNANPAILDVDVRRALAMALNKQQLIDTVGGGIGRPANGPFPPGSTGYLEDTGYPEYDPEEAQRLVTAYEEENEPIRITYTTTSDSANRRTAEVLQGMWEAVGIEVTIDQTEQGQYILDSALGELQAWQWRSHGGYDPDQQSVWWHSDSYAPAGQISLNFNHFQDPEIDEAFDTIRRSGNQDERREAAEAVNRRFGEQVYDLWTTWTVWAIGHAPEVNGIAAGALPDGTPSTISGGAAHQLAQIWVES